MYKKVIVELDQTDVKILKKLLAHARLSRGQIARKVGVFVGTVIVK